MERGRGPGSCVVGGSVERTGISDRRFLSERLLEQLSGEVILEIRWGKGGEACKARQVHRRGSAVAAGQQRERNEKGRGRGG